eukprot:11211859-Lingulodinium_polyedra.AAC.1
MGCLGSGCSRDGADVVSEARLHHHAHVLEIIIIMFSVGPPGARPIQTNRVSAMSMSGQVGTSNSI